ncbi:hypothetical protein RF11_15488 [Thelohanellus kitauei]|uniref:Uncharacterized protein n=1 Tax=Thelohanellus kitauei TaxID=669202 RepID=A0A0C2MN31_THEKT|nr:hypothetical protein RF11_15488 [Thelohanellus kitauei]
MARHVTYALLIYQLKTVLTIVSKNPCWDHEDCKSCISHPLCVWVTKMDDYLYSPATRNGTHHCVLRQHSTQFKSEDIYDPEPSFEPRRMFHWAGLIFEPDNVVIRAKAGAQVEFELSVKPVQAKILNIYFLIHRTMALKNILAIISDNLDEIVQGLEKNF